MTGDHLDVGGLRVHHVDAGPVDGEAVVLIHGITATHRFWRANIEHLARRRRVIALDLPGFGRSDKPDASYTMGWFVDVVARVLDAKGIARAHLVGNSMGGQIAMLFALRHAARVGRLVLVDPAGVTAIPWRLLHLVARGPLTIERPPPVPMAAVRFLFHRMVFPERPEIASRYVRSYADAVGSSEFPLHFRAFVRSARGVLGEPVRGRERHIRAPTLIVWGARDRLVPVTAARPLRKRMPTSRLLIYRESGHCPMVDQPERWNRDVERFLDGETVGR